MRVRLLKGSGSSTGDAREKGQGTRRRRRLVFFFFSFGGGGGSDVERGTIVSLASSAASSRKEASFTLLRQARKRELATESSESFGKEKKGEEEK